jgi:hypothetical protein
MPLVNAKHLAPGPGGKYEPQRNFDWQLELQVPGSEIIKLAVASVTGITESNEPIELHYGNEVHYVAGKARFEAGQIVVRDMVDVDVNAQINEWRRKVYDPHSGEIHYASAYKAEGDLILLDPEGAERATWHIVGLWPQNVNFGDLDYESNDIVRIQVVMTFDRAYRA